MVSVIEQFTALMDHLDDVYGRDTKHLARPVHYHLDRIDSDEPSHIYYTDRADAVEAANEDPARYTIIECTDPACTEEEWPCR